MKAVQFVIFSCLGVFMHSPSVNTQSIWGWGTIPLAGDCTKVGFQLLPGIEDPWLFNAHCLTFNGTAGCFDNKCICNQGADSYFSLPLQVCVGRVGAVCSTEHSNLFPDKLCTPNADCVPDQGEGYSVGKCQCLYGFKPDVEGMCIEDLEIDPEKRSTPRTTTTSKAPEREEFKLPLKLLLDSNIVNFEQECQPKALLNRTRCNTYGRTVSCQEQKCQCNMMKDSIFDERLNMCAGLAGTYCLARKYILGYKPCTVYADCVLEDGTSFDEGFSFGTCQCIYGYKETTEGTCVRDESITNPSTQGTIVPPTSTTPKRTPFPTRTTGPTTPTNTGSTTDNTTPESGGGEGGAVGIHSTCYTTGILLSILYMIIF